MRALLKGLSFFLKSWSRASANLDYDALAYQILICCSSPHLPDKDRMHVVVYIQGLP